MLGVTTKVTGHRLDQLAQTLIMFVKIRAQKCPELSISGPFPLVKLLATFRISKCPECNRNSRFTDISWWSSKNTYLPLLQISLIEKVNRIELCK